MDKKKDQSHAACQHYGTDAEKEPCKSCYKMFSNFTEKEVNLAPEYPDKDKFCSNCIDSAGNCEYLLKCSNKFSRPYWRPDLYTQGVTRNDK
jgi:hypothetical protein